MDKAQLETARAALLRLQAQLVAQQKAAAGSDAVVELDQSKVGRLSRMDAMQAQAMARASAQRRAAAMQGVSAALNRIESGDYGYCVECEEPIDPKRLEFDPAAVCCIQCAGRLEQA